MAEPYSTRRKARSSRLGSGDRRRSVESPGLHRQRAPLFRPSGCRPTASAHAGTSAQLISQLRELSRLLTVIYSTCVTAELALQGQNADHDRDILAMLRIHVSEPVSRQVEKLDLLVVELGGIGQDGCR
jgi:hypothetical protein